MNPKPFFSLNHFTVPLAIESTERANHSDPDFAKQQKFHLTKALGSKRPRLYGGPAKNVKRNATLLFPVGYVLPSAARIALFSLCLIPCLVAVVMGSKSDWSTMHHASDLLREFGVQSESKIVSAHRTPDLLVEFAKQAANQGLQVIIAGAGGAAHLPGMLPPIPISRFSGSRSKAEF